MTNTNHFNSSRQTKWSLYGASSTGSTVRMNIKNDLKSFNGKIVLRTQLVHPIGIKNLPPFSFLIVGKGEIL